jgi:Flp pilus assembly protein TadD
MSGAVLSVLAACSAGERPGGGGGGYESLLRIADGMVQTDPLNAVPLYRRAHELNPGSPEPLVRVGQAMLLVGNPPEAAAAFQDALKLSSNNPDALRGLGAALIAMDQAELALGQYEAAMRADSNDPRALNGAGVALDVLGRHDEAQARYAEALRVDPNYLSARNNYGLSLVSSGRYPEAIDVLLVAARHPEASPRTRGNLALAYGMQGDMEQALRWLRADMDALSANRYLAYFGQLRSAGPAVAAASIRANPEYYPRGVRQ